MTSLAIVDAGPLVAWAVESDAAHGAVVRVLERADFRFVIPALVLAEAAYLVGRRYGPLVEIALVSAIRDFEIEAPSRDDLLRMTELMEQYRDFPLGAADASVVALAERLDTEIIVTTDRRHVGAVRPRHCAAFRLLPEQAR